VSVQNPKLNSKMKTKSIFQLPLRHLWCRFVRDGTPSPWTSCRYSWSFTPWLLHWSSAERCRTSKNEASCWRSSGLSLVQNLWHQGPESYILTRVSTPKHGKGICWHSQTSAKHQSFKSKFCSKSWIQAMDPGQPRIHKLVLTFHWSTVPFQDQIITYYHYLGPSNFFKPSIFITY
jgi:hypothetical protein